MVYNRLYKHISAMNMYTEIHGLICMHTALETNNKLTCCYKELKPTESTTVIIISIILTYSHKSHLLMEETR